MLDTAILVCYLVSRDIVSMPPALMHLFLWNTAWYVLLADHDSAVLANHVSAVLANHGLAVLADRSVTLTGGYSTTTRRIKECKLVNIILPRQ